MNIFHSKKFVVAVFQVYSKSKEWDLLARWSVSFCSETQVYDETDTKLLHLVSYSAIEGTFFTCLLFNITGTKQQLFFFPIKRLK